MKKIIEVEKLTQILNLMGEMPVKVAFDVVTKMIEVIESSPNYVEPKEEIKEVETIKKEENGMD